MCVGRSRRDGYYDDTGRWQRTKFCFRACGDSCTCGPPGGQWYSEVHDKSLHTKRVTSCYRGTVGCLMNGDHHIVCKT